MFDLWKYQWRIFRGCPLQFKETWIGQWLCYQEKLGTPHHLLKSLQSLSTYNSIRIGSTPPQEFTLRRKNTKVHPKLHPDLEKHGITKSHFYPSIHCLQLMNKFIAWKIVLVFVHCPRLNNLTYCKQHFGLKRWDFADIQPWRACQLTGLADNLTNSRNCNR